MSESQIKGGYYVYELSDPRDCIAFYVGKGQGNRIHQHVNEVRRGKTINSAKCKKIKSILDAGFQVRETIVEWFDSETDALQAEAELIEQHGLENLTNVYSRGAQSNPLYKQGKLTLMLYMELQDKETWIKSRNYEWNEGEKWHSFLVCKCREIMRYIYSQVDEEKFMGYLGI